MEKNDCSERIRNFYHVATVGQDKKISAEAILDALHVPYYYISYFIPSEEPDLSPAFGYLFRLLHLAGSVRLLSPAYSYSGKR